MTDAVALPGTGTVGGVETAGTAPEAPHLRQGKVHELESHFKQRKTTVFSWLFLMHKSQVQISERQT